MAFQGDKTNIAADNTTAAEVSLSFGPSVFCISVYAVDANDAYEAVAAGTANLEVKIAGSSQWEPVYQSDGTTAVSFDVTAAPESVTVENVAAVAFRTTPTALTAAKKLRLYVAY